MLRTLAISGSAAVLIIGSALFADKLHDDDYMQPASGEDGTRAASAVPIFVGSVEQGHTFKEHLADFGITIKSSLKQLDDSDPSVEAAHTVIEAELGRLANVKDASAATLVNFTDTDYGRVESDEDTSADPFYADRAAIMLTIPHQVAPLPTPVVRSGKSAQYQLRTYVFFVSTDGSRLLDGVSFSETGLPVAADGNALGPLSQPVH
jgi:hypothetical protein